MTAVETGHEVSARRTTRSRRVTVWIAIGVALLVVGGIGGALGGLGEWNERDALDPESAGALGTRAVVELLRDQGVDVVIARARDDAERALRDDDATLVLPDAPALSDDGLARLGDAATDVVLVEPRSRDLRVFLPGTATAGVALDSPVDPACDLAEAERSGPVAPGRTFEAGGGAITACYPSGEGAGLLVRDDGERRLSAVDGRTLFVNETLADDGNAALALNLMGRHARVVWYVPSLGDTDLETAQPSLGDLTPPWVSPVIVLLLTAGVTAGIWRGRRFGPLVAERLPVTVRAAETTEGRGRLYARARDASHAADQLRIGALGRLSRVLALGKAASATEIADAVAIRTGFDRGAVRGILIDEIPAGDGELLTLRARLRDLEDAVDAAVRPERTTR
ncbi:DUF4350 domain-containing protein [Planococcus sp. APC 4015]|nr:DUF4350 domain-containing protein [Planococcus sp. APC 4015]